MSEPRESSSSADGGSDSGETHQVAENEQESDPSQEPASRGTKRSAPSDDHEPFLRHTVGWKYVPSRYPPTMNKLIFGHYDPILKSVPFIKRLKLSGWFKNPELFLSHWHEYESGYLNPLYHEDPHRDWHCGVNRKRVVHLFNSNRTNYMSDHPDTRKWGKENWLTRVVVRAWLANKKSIDGFLIDEEDNDVYWFELYKVLDAVRTYRSWWDSRHPKGQYCISTVKMDIPKRKFRRRGKLLADKAAVPNPLNGQLCVTWPKEPHQEGKVIKIDGIALKEYGDVVTEIAERFQLSEDEFSRAGISIVETVASLLRRSEGTPEETLVSTMAQDLIDLNSKDWPVLRRLARDSGGAIHAIMSLLAQEKATVLLSAILMAHLPILTEAAQLLQNYLKRYQRAAIWQQIRPCRRKNVLTMRHILQHSLGSHTTLELETKTLLMKGRRPGILLHAKVMIKVYQPMKPRMNLTNQHIICLLTPEWNLRKGGLLAPTIFCSGASA